MKVLLTGLLALAGCTGYHPLTVGECLAHKSSIRDGISYDTIYRVQHFDDTTVALWYYTPDGRRIGQAIAYRLVLDIRLAPIKCPKLDEGDKT
jgi:hypothetical protein